MAKTPTFSAVTNSDVNASEINSAIQAVADQFEQVLFLDGTTPNAMNADLDMNSNDILNASSVGTARLLINGNEVSASDLVLSALVISQEYATVAALLASTDTYTAGAYVHVVEGDHYYKAAASGDVTNAGGQQFEVLPHSGCVSAAAFQMSTSATPSENKTRFEKACAAAAANNYTLVLPEIYETDEVTIDEENLVIQSAGSRSTISSSKGGLKLPSGSSDTNMINVTGAGLTLRNLVLNANLGPTASGTSVVTAEQGGTNKADIDLYVEGCTIGNAETVFKMNGRGHYVHNCNIVKFTHFTDFEGFPGTGFVAGVNDDQTIQSGFRAFHYTSNRFHAGSAGYLFQNNGDNKEYLSGLLFDGNYIDTKARLFSGYLAEGVFSGNILKNSEITATALMVLTGGRNIQVNGGSYGGMRDNGSGVAYEILHFADLTRVNGFQMNGVNIYRCNNDVVKLDNSSVALSGITQANPPVVTTAASHGLATGDMVQIKSAGGMTEINNEYSTITVTSATTFTMDNIDASGYTAYTSGGTADGICANIQINGGVWEDVLLDNDSNTRYPVKLEADAVNLSFTGVNLKNEERANDAELIGQSASEFVYGTFHCVNNTYPSSFTSYDHSLIPSDLVNLPDDGVFSFRPKHGEGIVELTAVGASSIRSIKVFYEFYGAVRVLEIASVGVGWASSITTGSTPTGTTGVNGEITLFQNGDTFYLENRVGGALAAIARELPRTVT